MIRSFFSRLDPWPASIISFFTVAIIGCVSFVVFCNRHPVDLVAADYYEQEIRYQGQMENLTRGQQINAEVSYDAPRKQISISLPAGTLGTAGDGAISLYRPSDAVKGVDLEPGDAARALENPDLLDRSRAKLPRREEGGNSGNQTNLEPAQRRILPARICS